MEHMHRFIDTQNVHFPIFLQSVCLESQHERPFSPDAAVPLKTMEDGGDRARSAQGKEEKLVAAEVCAQLNATPGHHGHWRRMKCLFSKNRPSARKKLAIGNKFSSASTSQESKPMSKQTKKS